ncbi:hypothetical protein Dimus_003142 [Dionaea muscipula]
MAPQSSRYPHSTATPPFSFFLRPLIHHSSSKNPPNRVLVDGSDRMALSIRPSMTSLAGKTPPLRPPILPSPRVRISTSSSFSVDGASSSNPATAAGTGKRTPKGIAVPRPVSPELQAFLGGVSEIPRTQVLKATSNRTTFRILRTRR